MADFLGLGPGIALGEWWEYEPIPDRWVHQDLQARSVERLLLQFRRSPVILALLNALVYEIQQLQDEAEKVTRLRELAVAEGEQLDALGRIVGQPRRAFIYSDDVWFAPDIEGQNRDVTRSWVPNGYVFDSILLDDNAYRLRIRSKIQRNFSRYGSIEEIQKAFKTAFSSNISFVRVGIMEVDVYVPPNLPDYALGAIVNFMNTNEMDEKGELPWPATLRVRNVLTIE